MLVKVYLRSSHDLNEEVIERMFGAAAWEGRGLGPEGYDVPDVVLVEVLSE